MCPVRGVFSSSLLVYRNTVHYKSLAKLKTEEHVRKISAYLPSTTFSTYNYRLVYRGYLALDVSVGLLSHCKDVRFQILAVKENIHI